MAVDLFEQTLIAYEDDKPVFATLVSSGLPDWSTNEGVFEIWARLDRDSMSGATGAPDAYALAGRALDDVFRQQHQLARHLLA